MELVVADARGVTVPVRRDPSGRAGPTKGQARGPNWRCTSYGYYVPSSVDGARVEQRIVEAARVLPAYGAVTGWAALAWRGGRWFTGAAADASPLPVPLAMVDGVRPQSGIRVCSERLAPDDLTVVDGLPVTTAVRSVCFEMRYARSLESAVAVLDMAAYDDLVSVAELARYAAAHAGWTGIPQCRDAALLADENAWSPQETSMRLAWRESRLGVPLANRPVFDRGGRLLGTPDLIDPAAGVVGEYDGRHHLQHEQRVGDVDREERFRSRGLEVVTMLGADREGFIRRLVAAYRRAHGRAPTWTLEQPAWWTDTSDVAARRALPPDLRHRLLRYRAG